jgi:hypothetical protein
VRWGAIAAFWLAAAAFLYSQRLLWAAMGITRMEVREVWIPAAAAYAVCMGLWALLTPGLLRLVERFHFQRGARLRSSLVHGVLGTVLAVGMNAVGWDLARHLYGRPRLRLEVYLVNNLDTDLFLYLIVVGGASALRFHRDFREQEVRAARLQARLAGERLEAVKMRLEPPFLYAALDSVAAAVRRDPDRAELMVSSLGDVLRAKVASAGAELVPLRDELEFAAAYAELQRLRAGDAFGVELDAAPGLAGALVPPFVLQPLLDQAVRVASGAAGGGPPVRLAVRAGRSGGSLALEVRTAGGPAPDPGGEPAGLRELRARLHQAFGPDYTLVASRAGGGWAARLVLPLVEEAAERAGALPAGGASLAAPRGAP